MRKPSWVGEASAVVAVIDFIMWGLKILPDWTKWLLIPFGILLIIDWMKGGIADKGVFR